MKTGLKRGLVLGLTACMAATSLTGCGSKELDPTAAVATLNGTEISVGVANCILRYQQAQFETMYGSWLKSYYGTDLWNTDLTGSGTTYGTTFKDEIMTSIEKMHLAEQHMEEYGVELTEDEKTAISEAAAAFVEANGEEVLNEMNATTENVERMLTLYTIQYKVEECMGADVDTEVSDEEAAQRTVSYVRFDAKSEEETEEVSTEAAETEAAEEVAEAVETENETAAEETSEATVTEADSTKTEAADETEAETEDEAAVKAETKERAEAFLAVAKEAEDFAAAAEEVTANDPDTGYSYYTFGDDDTYPDEAIITATKDLEDGAVVDEVIEVNESYYVLHVDDAFDEDAVADKKEEIIETRRLELVQDIYDEWMDAAEFKVDEKAYAKLLFDIELTIEYATEETTEAVTEAGAEEVTEAATESETEEVTETVAEAETEEATEAVTEVVTEAVETETEK